MITKRALVAAFACAASSVAMSGPLELYQLQKMQHDAVQGLRSGSTNTRTDYYAQLIDHKNPKLGTFQQRYYVDETYGRSNDAPVFLYICGEVECNAHVFELAIKQVAQKYHAKMVALEHRYYGKSIPVKTFSTNNMQYLSTDYALRDLDRFQHEISKANHWTGKWVAFGGSYPGSLAAYYRLHYPKNVVGSLASSAPVQAKEKIEIFDEHVTEKAGLECAENTRRAYREVEAAMSDPEKMAAIKHDFMLDKLQNNLDLLFLVADVGTIGVQYGIKDTYCSLLKTQPTPLKGTATFARLIMGRFGITDPMMVTPEGIANENPENYQNGIGLRQWYYQSCREYGYWQVASEDRAKSTRSSLLNLDYFRDACERMFGIKTRTRIDDMNKRYYTPLMNESTSNIFLTNGTEDPWSHLSMSKENGNASNPNLTYYTIEDGSHCSDFYPPTSSDNASKKEARAMLSDLLGKWLS